MNLSTSSSKGRSRLAIVSLITGMVMLLCYALVFPYAFPEGGTPQGQRQENIIRSQNYVYKDVGARHVIVGTSISARMRKTWLGEDIYNLSITGGNIFSGLDVIVKSGRYPETVLIETNFFIRAGDDKFMDNLFAPGIHHLRALIPAMRDEYQPAAYALSATNKLLRLLLSDRHENRDEASEKEAVFDLWLDMQRKDYAQLPDAAEVKKKINRLKGYVAALKKNKVNVLFYEMPMHPALMDSPKAAMLRASLMEAFPAKSFNWVPLQDYNGYKTTDVIHLDDPSAEKYARILVKEAFAIIKSKNQIIQEAGPHGI